MPVKTKTGIEGTFVWKKKQKKAAVNVNKNMHVGLGKQLKEAKAVLAEEDVPIDCSPPCTQEFPEENFSEVVLLATFGVRKCHGCKGQIIRKNCQPPKDSVFLHAGPSNMEAKSTKYHLEPMLWQHLFSLNHIRCTEAQQQNEHSGCHHGCWHIHSADTQTLVLPLPKMIVGDNSCKTKVITMPFDTKLVSTEHKLSQTHYISYISTVCTMTLRLYS